MPGLHEGERDEMKTTIRKELEIMIAPFSPEKRKWECLAFVLKTLCESEGIDLDLEEEK